MCHKIPRDKRAFIFYDFVVKLIKCCGFFGASVTRNMTGLQMSDNKVFFKYLDLRKFGIPSKV